MLQAERTQNDYIVESSVNCTAPRKATQQSLSVDARGARQHFEVSSHGTNSSKRVSRELLANVSLVSQLESQSSSRSILSRIDPNSQAHRASRLPYSKENSAVHSSNTHTAHTAHAAASNLARRFSPCVVPFSQKVDIDHDAEDCAPVEMSGYSRTMEPMLNESQIKPLPTPIHGQRLNEQLQNRRGTPVPSSSSRQPAFELNRQLYPSRSPSVIPEPSRYVAPEEVKLESHISDVKVPLRQSGDASYSAASLSKPILQEPANQVTLITELGPPSLGKLEFVVPLSLPGRIRDQYYKTVQFYQKQIQAFLASHRDAALLRDIETLVTRLHRICTHVDLEHGITATQQDVSLKEECDWAIGCSTKFQFLRSLLQYMHDQNERIAIVAQRGEPLDMLEKFMMGNNVNYERIDSAMTSSGSATSALFVSLVASGPEKFQRLPNPVGLIIAFDPTFSLKDEQVRSLRSHHLYPGRLAPVIHPLVFCSAEHIRHCVPEMASAADKLRTVVSCVQQTRGDVGDLSSDESRPDAAAEEVAEFVLAGGTPNDWTLPKIRPIRLQGAGMQVVNFSRDTIESSYNDATESGPSALGKRFVVRTLV